MFIQMSLVSGCPHRFTFFLPNLNGKSCCVKIRNSSLNCGKCLRNGYRTKRNCCWTWNNLNWKMNSDGCSSVSLTCWDWGCSDGCSLVHSDGCNSVNSTCWGWSNCYSDGCSLVSLTGQDSYYWSRDGCKLKTLLPACWWMDWWKVWRMYFRWTAWYRMAWSDSGSMWDACTPACSGDLW